MIHLQRSLGLAMLFVCLVSVICSAQQPREVWAYQAKSNLYAPPLAADVHPSPGKEIIVSDSEVRRLRCISATGEQLWEADGGWKRRLISAAALSDPMKDGARLLVVGNADGNLVCFEAATGAKRWRVQAGGVEWGGGLWADINGDNIQEFVFATLHDGVAVYNAEGQELWRYKGAKDEPALEIPCVSAVCDVDGDKKSEIFCATTWGVFCLNGDGSVRWEKQTGDDFTASVIINETGLFSMSRNDHYMWRLDPATGDIKWKRAVAAGADVYNGSGLALGDANGDGGQEIVGSDREGNVYAFGMDSDMRWMFSTRKRVHAAVTLGDVDGDGRVDVLVASGDHCLYALDGTGREQWRYETGLRLVGPATIDDIDGDGKTEILVCGSDRTLHCLTMGGRYDSALVPWPSRRFNTSQSGCCISVKPERRLVETSRSLFEFGDFKQGKVQDGLQPLDSKNPFYKEILNHPRGWRCESPDGKWELFTRTWGDREEKCLKTSDPCEVVSDFISLPTGLQSVEVGVCFVGTGFVAAELRWIGDAGIIGIKTLEYQSEAGGWHSYFAKDTPPRGARMAAVSLRSEGTDCLWSGVTVISKILEPVTATVLINQVGYDIGAPKHFVVQANLDAKEARFALLNKDGSVSFEGALEPKGRIVGRFGQDWGNQYYKGDLSGFDAPGQYRIQVSLDGVTAESWPFEIGENVLWKTTARPAYRFFWYQRCGMEIPGFHGACHLDDAVGPDGKTTRAVSGGWHDAGDYNKYQNAPYVFGLARAYGMAPKLFNAIKPENEEGFLDEILWGGAHVRRMITEDGSSFGSITSGYGFWGPPELETDNIPGTGDERPASSVRGDNPSEHQAALARIAVLLREQGIANVSEWVEPAERSLEYSLEQNQRGLHQLSTAIDLFRATNESKYSSLAKDLFAALQPKPDQDPSAMLVDVVRQYDRTFGEDHSAVLKSMLVKKADALVTLAGNSFGVCTLGPADKPNFFGTPEDKGGWHVGTSSYLFESATIVALAYQYNPDPKYLEFVYDQFNWTLGMNPFNTSIMESVGSANLPSYHNRIAFGGVARGAVPGSVVNGLTWRAVADDRPYLDLSGVDIPSFESNECWLPHNTAYLNALASLEISRSK